MFVQIGFKVAQSEPRHLKVFNSVMYHLKLPLSVKLTRICPKLVFDL